MTLPTLHEWLQTIDLDRYAPLFVDNEIDLATLLVLTERDLEQLGLPFGPRKRVLSAVALLRQLVASEEATGDVSGEAPVAGEAGERRQLTVLFSDIVGFTELAGRLDPEVLNTVVRRYEDVCAISITRYEGYVFQRVGDGIVAFFGYPLAHEGEAERAVRAGLEIMASMAELEVPEVVTLEARIGIATGMVMVSPGEGRAFGETMNLAARLQAVAEPSTVVVSPRVRRLAGGAFEYTDLGEHELKGISKPSRVYRVLGPSVSDGRFEAATRSGLTPLVGRDVELDGLLERWSLTQEEGGGGRVVLLAGEPGIGKSRTVSVLRERLGEHGAGAIVFHCSPFGVNSAFHPIIASLERALAGPRQEPPEVRLGRLQALVSEEYGRPLADVPPIASILALPAETQRRPSKRTPQERKSETIRALVELTEAMVRSGRRLLIVEDVHWADPTTLETLDALFARVASLPLLVVLTHRPDFVERWSEQPYVSKLDLTRLSRSQSEALVLALTGGLPLPDELLDQIVEKTDGVPLFVEELTKSLLESGVVAIEDGRYAFAGVADDVSVPDTLRDSLMARLDRLGPAQEIAQIGAVIGREFNFELVADVSSLPPDDLAQRVARLRDSGLTLQHGSLPDAVFTFKHALVHDVAYDTLLRSRRKELHGKIARALEKRWPEIAETTPELLAHHYTAAGEDEVAVRFWERAGEVALERFAMAEAVAHLSAGLALVERLPPSPERDLRELELRTLLGPPLVAVRGWAAPEVSSLLEPAITLARSLGQHQSYLPVLNGLWVHFMSAGRHATAIEWADELLATGAANEDDVLVLCGHRAAMTSNFWLGNLDQVVEHGNAITTAYDAERHWHIAARTNNDPLTADGIYRSQALWMLGFPDRAAVLCDEKDEWARRRDHPFDRCFALTVGALAYDYRRDPDRLLERVEEAERVGRAHHVPLMSEVMAQIVKGIAWLRAGRTADSVPQLEDSLARLLATGHRAWVPYVRAVLGEALARQGDLDAGLARIGESLDQIVVQDERVHLPEVLRLQGWMLWQQGSLDEAEGPLRAAVEIAREQRTRSWELRAATTLADLIDSRGNAVAALEQLQPVYETFDEGFDTPDLADAALLLQRIKDTIVPTRPQEVT
jgi:class 3 adenylate cyclase/tetratricopeptide (TPR) repeat protein